MENKLYIILAIINQYIDIRGLRDFCFFFSPLFNCYFV